MTFVSSLSAPNFDTPSPRSDNSRWALGKVCLGHRERRGKTGVATLLEKEEEGAQTRRGGMQRICREMRRRARCNWPKFGHSTVSDAASSWAIVSGHRLGPSSRARMIYSVARCGCRKMRLYRTNNNGALGAKLLAWAVSRPGHLCNRSLAPRYGTTKEGLAT